jgi:hypothetical protein
MSVSSPLILYNKGMKLCECGCGNPAPIATSNNTRFGYVKGQPRRFVSGHQFARPQLTRFLDKIIKTDTCWIWTACRSRAGYAKFDGTLAHRVSYRLFKGELAKGQLVMHSCDNPLCVNPDHLSIGTNADNSRDMVNKGRQAFGERSPKAKLTNEQVAAIRELYIPGYGGYGCHRLAKDFGVSKATIRSIVHSRTWRASSVQQ